jgi:hypothetical protein
MTRNGSNKVILCCEMTEESNSDNHLILPALREPEVNFLLRFRVETSSMEETALNVLPSSKKVCSECLMSLVSYYVSQIQSCEGFLRCWTP